jgi:hypothetical protein
VFWSQYELCDFLLKTFESFRKEDQLQEASKTYGWFIREHVGEQILELFAGKHSMNVDITGPDHEIPDFMKFQFCKLSKVIMSHQSIGLNELSLEDRFDIAMRLSERTPTEFLDTVGIGIGDGLLALNDRLGATVLHWTATQWSMAQGMETPSPILTLHANLMVSLLKAGSELSAVDTLGYSPLMYALMHDNQWPNRWHSYPRKHEDPLILINSWMRLIASTDISVPAYVETENSLLKSLETDHIVRLFYQDRWAELDSIIIGDDMNIKINVKLVTSVDIRERTQPPGSFEHPIPMPSNIWWFPCDIDSDDCHGEYHHWKTVDSGELKSDVPFTLTPDSMVEAQRDMTTILFQRSQDDSGPVAAVFQRNHQRISRERNNIPTRRRSVSTGPPANPFYRYVSEVPQTSLLQEGYPRCLRVHKCPFDLQWGFVVWERLEPHDMWRNCMRGCPGRPDHASNIADTFRPLVP